VGIVKTKRRQKPRARGDKKPAQAAQKNLSRSCAVSREYRGKMPLRKEYFTLHLSSRAKSRNL
jgi:hypothetical protein